MEGKDHAEGGEVQKNDGGLYGSFHSILRSLDAGTIVKTIHMNNSYSVNKYCVQDCRMGGPLLAITSPGSRVDKGARKGLWL